MKFLQKISSSKTMQALSTMNGLSFLLGLILGAVSIYGTFIYEKKASIEYELISESNVLDIKEQVGKLEVFFDGIDIQKSGMNLRMIIFAVKNIGGVDILKEHYAVPLGFRIDTGKIVDVGVVNASSDYLLSAPQPSIESENTVLFQKFIFDKKNFFSLKVLILHDKKQVTPNITALGKVAGVDKIVTSRALQEAEPSVILKVFKGDFVVQLLRVVAYSLVTVILIIVVVIIVTLVASFRHWGDVRKDLRKRKKVVKAYKDKYEDLIDPFFLLYLKKFVKNHAMDIYQIKAILDDKESIRSLVSEKVPSEPGGSWESSQFQNYMKVLSRHRIAERLIEDRVVSIEGDEVKVNKGFEDEAVRFLSFLQASGYQYRYIVIGWQM